MDAIRSFTVGAARVSVISIGDVTLPLAPAMRLSQGDLTGDASVLDLAEQRLIPLQSVLVRTEETVVLVDAGLYDVPADSEYAVPNYMPPPPLVESLAALGVGAGDVEHVVITHRHWDHFNGTSLDGRDPTFPRARHYIGAADWRAMQDSLADPASRESRSIAAVARAGLVVPIGGLTEIARGITVHPAPGETEGHQIVRVESGSPPEVIYALGDMYHHPAEFARPAWMVSWADPETNLASRRALQDAVAREDPLLVASHIPSVGRLRREGTGFRWTPV